MVPTRLDTLAAAAKPGHPHSQRTERRDGRKAQVDVSEAKLALLGIQLTIVSWIQLETH